MKYKEIKDDINTNTKQVLKPSFSQFLTDEPNEENEKIIALINLYTRQKEKSLSKTLSDVFLRLHYGVSYNDIKPNEDKNNYKYISKDGQIITFDMISKYMVNESDIKELTSNKRAHKCHNNSVALAQSIENSIILTGYIVVGKYKILHSVVETSMDNHTVIFDYSNNLIMNKEDYINLFKFTLLSKITIEDILKDLDIIKKSPFKLSNKTYLVFRDEIMRDLEKNKALFEPNNTTRKK